ncbi:MAG: M23 family metallopeptidase [Candidatus Competibacteraceae bacterium]|nr:M23 family metallopeptidase [Candidatus Competibacteraceae bacterium]
MAKKKKRLANWWRRLRTKYRVQVISEDHFEEKASWRLSAFNIVIVFSMIVILMVSLTIYLVAFTNLREYIPGYADSDSKRKLIELAIITDSLEKQSAATDLFLDNLKLFIQGKEFADSMMYRVDTTRNFDAVEYLHSKEDSILRQEVLEADRYNLSPVIQDENNPLSGILFFTPLRGALTQKFDKSLQHFGVDIASKKNEAVKAVLNGTVIFSAWTSDAGYVLIIQHSEHLVSVYMHNAVLLKKTGAFVKSGEPVAIVGNSGQHTTGPHLHFELWHKGIPVNPELFMRF